MNALFSHGGEWFNWLLQATWQASVLAILILLVQFVFRKHLSPAWRYGLWLLLIARLLIPNPPPSALSIFNLANFKSAYERQPVSSVASPDRSPSLESDSSPHSETRFTMPAHEQFSSIQPSVAVPPGNAWRVDWFGVFFAVWFAGAVLFYARLVLLNARFHRDLSSRPRISNPRIDDLLQECRSSMRVRDSIVVIETSKITTPAVCGFLRKKLLLPEGMGCAFSDDELRHVFMHELAHVKRRDIEVNWIVAVLESLHWFNPILRFAFGRMRADRELAADALALAQSRVQDKASYGETILKVLERTQNPAVVPGVVGIAEDKLQLQQRLIEIVRHGKVRYWKWLAAGVAGAIAIGALTDAAVDAQTGVPVQSASELPGPAQDTLSSVRTESSKRFELRIVDHESKQPVPGVSVKLTVTSYDRPSKSPLRPSTTQKVETRVTAADGIAAFEYSTNDLGRLAYVIEKPGFLTLAGDYSLSSRFRIPEAIDIWFSEGVELGGVVVDEAGKPVAGAELFFPRSSIQTAPISIAPLEPAGPGWVMNPDAPIAVTDADGRWRARCVYPGTKHVPLRVRHPDYADAAYGAGQNPPDWVDKQVPFEDFLALRAKFVLARGITVNGKVVDESGRPMPGVPVWWTDGTMRRTDRSPYWYWDRTVVTDAQGRFVALANAGKTLTFMIETNGYAITGAELDLQLSAPEFVLPLKKANPLDLRIVDAVSGASVSNVGVSIVKGKAAWIGVTWHGTTDEDGRLIWTNAPAQKYSLRFMKTGYDTLVQPIVPGGEHIIRLNPALRVVAKVSDAITGRPLPKFRIASGAASERVVNLSRRLVDGSDGVHTVIVPSANSGNGQVFVSEVVIRVEADGYEPETSRVFSPGKTDVGEIVWECRMRSARKVSVHVVDTGGTPVPAAQIALKTPTIGLRLAGRPRLEPNAIFPETDSNGVFSTALTPEVSWIIAVHERGIAWTRTAELEPQTTLVLQPWARIEGSVMNYGVPAAGQDVGVYSRLPSDWPPIDIFRHTTTCDSNGNFAFDYVAPNTCYVYPMISTMQGGGGSGFQQMIEPEPGKTSIVKLGGGRKVIGRFKVKNPYVALDWSRGFIFAGPENGGGGAPVQISRDGAFRIDWVSPGKYQISLNLSDPRDKNFGATGMGASIVSKTIPFTVPESGKVGDIHDLGDIELVLRKNIEPGKTEATGFDLTDMSGRRLRLSDFRGRYVLLDFWASWCGPCVEEVPQLKAIYEQYGKRSDFVMISLSLDKTPDDAREFVQKHSIRWRQGYLGDWANADLPDEYGVLGIPALFLIDPNGVIIAGDLRARAAVGELQKWLK